MTRSRLPLTALLGMGGLAGVGPLVATLLVGRTAMAPSLRWMGLCAATWMVLGALAWARARGSVWEAARTVAPVAAVAVFLPWAYLSDSIFHALSGARWQALGALAVLALLGLVRGGSLELGGAEPVHRSGSAALLTVVVGMGLMYGLNDVLFEPLGAPPGGPLAAVRYLAPVLPAVMLALLVWAQFVSAREVGALGTVAGIAGLLAVWLGVAPAGAALFGAAAIGMVAVADAGSALRPAARVALVGGVALAATDMTKYGLGARELIAMAPDVARLLPAIGLLVTAAVLARVTAAHTSRSAAIGGTREA